jgi:hypothetical protein
LTWREIKAIYKTKMQFYPGDVITAQLGKSNPKEPAGVKLEEKCGKFYISKVSGLAKKRQIPIQAGDQLLKLNDRKVGDYKGGLKEMSQIIKQDQMRLAFQVIRIDPDVEDSSDKQQQQQQQPSQTSPRRKKRASRFARFAQEDVVVDNEKGKEEVFLLKDVVVDNEKGKEEVLLLQQDSQKGKEGVLLLQQDSQKGKEVLLLQQDSQQQQLLNPAARRIRELDASLVGLIVSIK